MSTFEVVRRHQHPYSDLVVAELNGGYYVAHMDTTNHHQFRSIGRDCPNNGTWVGPISDSGLQYVTGPRSREEAMRIFRLEAKAIEESYEELLSDLGTLPAR